MCLDESGGYHALLNATDKFVYRYYITGPMSDQKASFPASPIADISHHPHTPFCLKGCRPHGIDTLDGNPLIKPCSADAISGFSELYVPTRLDAGRAREYGNQQTLGTQPFTARVMYDAHRIPHGFTLARDTGVVMAQGLRLSEHPTKSMFYPRRLCIAHRRIGMAWTK